MFTALADIVRRHAVSHARPRVHRLAAGARAFPAGRQAGRGLRRPPVARPVARLGARPGAIRRAAAAMDRPDQASSSPRSCTPGSVIWSPTRCRCLFVGIAMLHLYPTASFRVLPAIYLGPGIAVWLFARDGNHVGASGLIYGLGRVCLRRRTDPARPPRDRRIAARRVPVRHDGLGCSARSRPGVSWETHLAAALIGVAMAFALRNTDLAPRAQYSWEREADAPEQVDAHDEPATTGSALPTAGEPRRPARSHVCRSRRRTIASPRSTRTRISSRSAARSTHPRPDGQRFRLPTLGARQLPDPRVRAPLRRRPRDRDAGGAAVPIAKEDARTRGGPRPAQARSP